MQGTFESSRPREASRVTAKIDTTSSYEASASSSAPRPTEERLFMQERGVEDNRGQQNKPQLSWLGPQSQRHVPRASQAMQPLSCLEKTADKVDIPSRQQKTDTNLPQTTLRNPVNPLSDAPRARILPRHRPVAERTLTEHRRALQADGPFTKFNTSRFANSAVEHKSKAYRTRGCEPSISSAPPTIPYRLQPSGPLGNTTMIDLLIKSQNSGYSALTQPHKSEDSQTLMQRLEEHEAKGKGPDYGKSFSAPPSMPERLGSSSSWDKVVEYQGSDRVSRELSSLAPSTEASRFRPGPSECRDTCQQSSLVRERPTSLATSTCPPHDRTGETSVEQSLKQVKLQIKHSARVGQPSSAPPDHPAHSRPSGETTAKSLLRFNELPESDSESMAERRRRLLELNKSLNRTHERRSPSASTHQALSPEGETGRGREGPSSTTVPVKPLLVKVSEGRPPFSSTRSHLDNQSSPSCATTTEWPRYKTEEEKRLSAQSGQSKSSGSDLDPGAFSSTSGRSGLTPASSLEKLADLKALEELVRRVPEADPAIAPSRADCLRESEEFEGDSHHHKQDPSGSGLKGPRKQPEGGINCDAARSGDDSTKAPSSEETRIEQSLIPEIESDDNFDRFQESSSQNDQEAQAPRASKGKGKASADQLTGPSAKDCPADEKVDRGRQLWTQWGTTRPTRSFSFSSAETVIRVSSRRPLCFGDDRRMLQPGSEGRTSAGSLASSTGTVVRAPSSPLSSRNDAQSAVSHRDFSSDRSESPSHLGAPDDNEMGSDVEPS